MPDIGDFVGGIAAFVSETIGSVSLRVPPASALALLAILLLLLYLLARPPSRWSESDLGGLQRVPRAMAVVAETGEAASFSLGTAGIARPATAPERMQTLAALPILWHIARAAARSGVPLEVVANDAVTVELARGAVTDAYAAARAPERAFRARVEYAGEGRPTPAARALAGPARPVGASYVSGGLAEEGLLLLTGATERAASTILGTASPTEAVWVLLLGHGALVGPELFAAAAVVRRSANERASVIAVNRLTWAAVIVVVVASGVALAGLADVAAFLVERP